MILVELKNLRETLKIATLAIKNKSPLHILSYALFEPVPDRDNIIKITCNNTETQVTTLCEVISCDIQTAFTLDPELLGKYLASFDNDTETVVIDPSQTEITKIRVGRAKVSLAALPTEELYNLSEDFDRTEIDHLDHHRIEIDGTRLMELLAWTHTAQAINDVRYYLNGTLIEINANSLRFVATDGYRLHTEIFEHDNPSIPETSIIVPGGAIESIIKLPLAGATATVTFTLETLCVSVLNTHFYVKTIQGKYPDWRKIIPKEKGVLVEIPKKTALEVLIRAKTINKDPTVTIKIDDRGATIQSKTGPNEVTDLIELAENTESTELCYQASYLIDAIRSLPDLDSNGIIYLSYHPDSRHLIINSEFDRAAGLRLVAGVRK